MFSDQLLWQIKRERYSRCHRLSNTRYLPKKNAR